MDHKISIIVPVYNAEKTLERCIVSLQEQLHSNIEIILVNDGSRDASLEICNRYAREDSRIRVVDKPNGGVSSARNAGLDAATGEFVMFCDSDDWAERDWCSCMYAHYVPGNLAVCEIHREDVPSEEHAVEEEIVERKEYLHYFMLMCPPYNKIFSREVIEKNQIRFSGQLSLGEDFVFCLQYLSALDGNVRFVYRKLYRYDTSNENSLSGKIPALEQCEAFYQAVTTAMHSLDAWDPQSVQTRDMLVFSHFERNLRGIATEKKMSLGQKFRHGLRLQRMEGFRNTCRNGSRWGNFAYVWLLRKGWAAAAMGILILRQTVKKS